MNFDISLEYYQHNDGIVSLAGFYKEVDGFIFGERITQTNFIPKPYGRLDLKANYRLTENISVFAELLNLNDAPFGEFQGKKEWVTRREF
jgi:outer membrane receptor protein involved in Fe transport